MNKTTKTIIIGLLIGLVGMFIGVLASKDQSTSLILGGGTNKFSAGNVAYNTTSSPVWSNEDFILDKNPQRQAAWVCTTSTSMTMIHYVASSTVNVSLVTGIPIAATTTSGFDSCHFIGPDNLYIGEIKAISRGVTTTLITTEISY